MKEQRQSQNFKFWTLSFIR